MNRASNQCLSSCLSQTLRTAFLGRHIDQALKTGNLRCCWVTFNETQMKRVVWRVILLWTPEPRWTDHCVCCGGRRWNSPSWIFVSWPDGLSAKSNEQKKKKKIHLLASVNASKEIVLLRNPANWSPGTPARLFQLRSYKMKPSMCY